MNGDEDATFKVGERVIDRYGRVGTIIAFCENLSSIIPMSREQFLVSQEMKFEDGRKIGFTYENIDEVFAILVHDSGVVFISPMSLIQDTFTAF